MLSHKSPGADSTKSATRVLLFGDQWDLLKPALMLVASQRGTVFIGPECDGLPEIAARTNPSVIMVSPGCDCADDLSALKDYTDEQASTPTVLRCITHESLEMDDLYEDADDFLIVPCTAAELDKRIRRLARRDQGATASEQLQIGNITLDLSTYQVTLDGTRVELAWMEFQLLKFLMHNPGRVFTREHLLAHVWGIDSFGGTRTVDVHIRRLRSKLEVLGDEYFRTVKNVGYGMVSPNG